MDIPKNNLKTAAGRKSLGTKFLPNENKKRFDWFDGTMTSFEDCTKYNVDDEDKVKGNQYDSAESPPEAVTKVPLKDYRPSSEVSLSSPKNKKRKFPNIEEILQNLNFDTLSLKFTKLLMFLESDTKELALPFTFKEYEEFFVIIVKDINILKSKIFDACYRHICDNIIKAATGYSLTYVYEFKSEFKKIVMVIRKEKNKMVDQSDEETRSFSRSEECIESSSNPSSKEDAKELSRKSSRPAVSNGFKIHCLRTMLAFIKYDEIKSKEFPELSPDQAHFMQSLLRYSGVAFNDFERNVEVKTLHRALWEAMTIYSLKYDFGIKCEDSWAGKKKLKFVKIPKLKCSIPVFEYDSNQIIRCPIMEFQQSEMTMSENLKSEAPKSVNPKSEIPKSEIRNSENPRLQIQISENPRSEIRNSENPRSQIQISENPRSEIQISENPRSEIQNSENPRSEIQILENPTSDIKISENPRSEIIHSENPRSEIINSESPRSEIQNSENPRSEIQNSENPRSEIQISENPRSEIIHSENPRSEIQISENPRSEIQNSEKPRSEIQNSENPKSEIEKPENPTPDVAEPWFAKPEVPKFVPVKQTTQRITKRMLRERIKEENEILFLKRHPTQFVADTLNSILEFLQNDEKQKLVFVPKTLSELEFYRKVLNWCRARYSVSKYGQEFERLHHMIQTLLPRVNIKAKKSSSNKYNATTGIKEMSFVKVPPRYKRFDPVSVQSTPKKKKVNLQNVLELAGTEQIQLASVVDLNQSLRNKKKNKKQKKAKLKKANAVASNEASAKAANRGSTGDSSSACSSRTTSGDRAQQVANNEMSSNPMKAKTWNEHSRSGSSSRASSWDRSQGFKGQHMPRRTMKASRREDETRKEQLIEALSVPVQSDKAMRMMRGMGWNGGALGARGDGITEPLMPKLDLVSIHCHPPVVIPFYWGCVPYIFLAHTLHLGVVSWPRGVGFGHARIPQPEPTPKKLKETIPTTSWVSENSKVLQDSENNMMVKKTKDVQLENPTFDSTMKTDELSKPNVELPTQSKPNVELPEPENSNLVMSQDFSRQEYLRGILELLNSDAAYRTLKYQNVIPVKSRKFVINAVQVINDRKVNYGIFLNEEFSIYTQIHFKCKSSPQIFVDAAFLYDFKTIELQKTQSDRHMPIEPNLPIEPVTPQPDFKIHSPERHTEIITEEEIKYYILSTCSQYGSAKALAQLKFKVLFLLNILNFVKSLNEEVEVTFNKILSGKEQMYIQNVVDEVNMRINFGSSPAETKLCSEINEHIEDAFLGAMFNHKYTVVTLNKYFRFKRLNRPDNVIRKSQTTVNLDIYKSATVSQAQVNICEPTDRENDNKLSENYNVAKNLEIFYENYKKDSETNSTVSENNNKVSENNNYEQVLPTSSAFTRSYDSDESSVEEYNSNNATATVPRLPPGEENVNISNFLYLYDKEKPNSQFSKNVDTIMNENKNYIGNGNVVIDNNDNQIIDMIRDGNFNTTDVNMDETESEIDSDDAEYDLCVEMSVDVGKDEDEVNITEDQRAGLNEQSIEHSDIAATSDGRPVNHHENIGVDNFDEIIDEGFLNAEDSDIKDLNSHSVCLGYILGDKLNDIPEDLNKNKYIKDQNVIMKENVTKMMKVISITDKEDLVKVTNTEDGIVVSKTIEENDDKNVRQKTKKIDNKSDCDRLIEAIVVLSENQCDTESVVLKSGTEINVPNYFQDMDSEIKTVRIVHSCHPLAKITKDKVTEIQKHISNAIMLTIDLPLLKCDGVQNGALVYSCHNKKTYDWLLNTISAANNVKVLNTYGVTKMALKFYCFFDYSSSLYLFKMIELYNRELSTENWVVEKTEKDGDYVIFIVKMDKFSIKFIQESGLSLFAGVDKVQFTPIWE